MQQNPFLPNFFLSMSGKNRIFAIYSLITKHHVIIWETIKNTISNMGNIVIKAQKQASYNIDGKRNVANLCILSIVGKIANYCTQISLLSIAYITSIIMFFVQCCKNFQANCSRAIRSKKTVTAHYNNNIAHKHFSAVTFLKHPKYSSHTKICRGFT